MNFLSTSAFFFAAAIPVVVLFYLLKRKRVVKLVSSTLLWEKFLAENQASSPFQKLRHNWLLLLQILLLILAVLALARPYIQGQLSGGRLQIVILDASASMQSADVAPSRFEAARRQIQSMIDGLADDDQMVLIQSAARTQVLQSPTNEKNDLRRALKLVEVQDSPTRLLEALRLSKSLAQANPATQVHLFTDGAATDLNEFENEDLNIVFHKIGEGNDNLAIVTMDVRAHPEDPLKRAIFSNVVNYSNKEVSAVLELLFEGESIDARALDLRAGETAPQVFVADQSVDGVFSLRLNVEDDLEVDNRASVVSLLPEPVEVLLVGSSRNAFLEKALRAVPSVSLQTADDIREGQTADLYVLDGVVPSRWPQGNVLAIQTTGEGWFDGVASLEAPPVVDWKGNHPLLRFVGFDNVQIAESLGARAPAWALSLVETTQHTLVLAGELARQRIVWIGFDVLDSTWPLYISFPIFIANAVDWLNPASAQAEQRTVKTGSPIRLILDESVSELRMRMPDGAVKTLPVDSGAGETYFAGTDFQGVYRWIQGTNELAFAANLLDAAESDTAPRSEIQLGQFGQIRASEKQTANLEFWRWIAAAGLAVLSFEWWFYHRRTA